MTKTAESKWRSLIAEQERSGLTARAFAESRGITPTTLYWWRSRLRQRGAALVPVTVVAHDEGADKESGAFELEFGEMTLRIPRGFAETDLRRLLQALRC
jgi:transposase-like protein